MQELSPRTDGLVDGPAITAASRTSCLPASKKFTLSKVLLPGSAIRLGTRLRFQASGRISSVITTPGTARFDLTINGAIMFDSLAILLETVAGHTNVPWYLEVILICRNGPGPGTQFWPARATWICEDIVGSIAAPAVAGVAMLPWNVAPALGGKCDTTGDCAFDMFFTQTAATGSLTVHDFCVSNVNDDSQ